MEKIALFPGSFDPLHEGHIDIIQRACKLFDKLYVVVSINTDKSQQSNLDVRTKKVKEQINKLKLDNVDVVSNNGLTIDIAKKLNCQYIVRSIRNAQDYEYELNIAQVHYELDQSIETVLFIAKKNLEQKSSTNVREIQRKLNLFNNEKK